MKKCLLLLFIISFISLFLYGCDNESPEYDNIQSSIINNKFNSAENVIFDLADILGKDKNDIVQTDVYRSQGGINLSGFLLKIDDLKYSDITNLRIGDYFDGWVSYQEGDGMREHYTQYLNDRIFCDIHGYTNADSDYLNSLVYSEDDNDVNYELANKLFLEYPYTIKVSCADFTEEFPSPLEFNFFVSGEEPFWDADITPSNVKFSTAGGLNDDLYPNIMKRTGNKLVIESDNYYRDLDFTVEIIKEDCVDGGIGNTHEYSVKLYNSEAIFEGCADKKDDFLVSQRRGKLSSFIKETGIDYYGKLNPEKFEYYLWTEGNLISLYLYNTEESEIPEEDEITNIILGKTDKGLETYWIGGDDIDDETCEKYHLVEGLMDFGLFNQCPRG